MQYSLPSLVKYSSRWGFVRIPAKVPQELGQEGCRVEGRKWKEISELMRRIFVVEARQDPRTDDIVYLCISPLFDELEEGAEAPEYEAWFESHRNENDGTEWVEFKRFERLSLHTIGRNTRW